MAIAFRSAGTLAVTSDLAPAIPYPAGLVAGDLLLLQFACIHSLTPATPSGWTKLLGPVAMAGTSPATDGHMYWKVAAGSESGSLTVTLSGTSNWAGGVMTAWSGVSGSGPVDASATATLATSGTTATAPSVTTTVANTRLLHIYWGYVNNSTVTPNASDTERYDAWNISINLGYELADRAQAATGATGTSAATWVGSALFGGLAATVALAPAAAASVPTAGFTGTPLSGTEPLAVTFTDSSTNTPTSWAWDFGDGGTSTAQNPTHTYTTAGTFTVALTATNSAGSNTLTRTGYVTVSDQPRPIRINTSQGWRDIADDTSFVSGSGTPTPAVGATGAIYLNTATGLHYGPKAAGAWPGTALPVPGGSSDPRFPSYGTTLPGSPVDGQEAILVDSTTAPTYRWRFRYNAGSSSTFKWEFIGGGALSNYLGTQQAVGSASTWVDLGTGQPIVTVPRAGDYRAEWRFRMLNADPAAQQAFVTVVPAGGTPGTIQAGSTAIAPSQVTDYSDFANPTRDASLAAIAASVTLRLMYYATSTNVSFSNRLLAVTPIRVS